MYAILRRSVPLTVTDNDYTDLSMETLMSGTKQRCRRSPFHIWTPMMPKMKKIKKHSIKMLPSIGSVSSNSVTRMRMSASATFTIVITTTTTSIIVVVVVTYCVY